MKRKNIILAGDFNCDMTPGVESNTSHFKRRFRRILCSYGLKDIINNPTRIKSDSKYLIVTSQPAKVQTSVSIDLGISDHHLILSVFEGARSNPKPLVISTKKYKQVEKSNLTQIWAWSLASCESVWWYRWLSLHLELLIQRHYRSPFTTLESKDRI